MVQVTNFRSASERCIEKSDPLRGVCFPAMGLPPGGTQSEAASCLTLPFSEPGGLFMIRHGHQPWRTRRIDSGDVSRLRWHRQLRAMRGSGGEGELDHAERAVREVQRQRQLHALHGARRGLTRRRCAAPNGCRAPAPSPNARRAGACRSGGEYGLGLQLDGLVLDGGRGLGVEVGAIEPAADLAGLDDRETGGQLAGVERVEGLKVERVPERRGLGVEQDEVAVGVVSSTMRSAPGGRRRKWSSRPICGGARRSPGRRP